MSLLAGSYRFLWIPLAALAAAWSPFVWNMELTQSASRQQASYDRDSDNHKLHVFMRDAGWCWFQDPRAIVCDGKLFIGGVKGNGDGQAHVSVFDLKTGSRIGQAELHSAFDNDDHNSPVFHRRPDGSILTVYARHGRERFHCSRFCDPAKPLTWSEESRHERSMPNSKDMVTYMNFCELKDEGKLYLFFRGIDFNPTFVTSSDHGTTWSEPVHFFKDELDGRHRPYARYASTGKDTIYVSVTDGHPRDFGNSIYYFEYRNGRFYRADGTLIRQLATDGALLPSEAELVFKGSGNPSRGPSLSAIGAAWTSSIQIDNQGYPHIAYTLYHSNADHRYRIASWNGTRWVDREVAFGGKCLYDRESSYTGLISLDPVDPTFVVISTDVNPTTGADRDGQHEIYSARINPHDGIRNVQWKPLTVDSPVRNMRPLIVRTDDSRIILWNRGVYITYTNYDLDTVGIIESVSRSAGE
ncbi:MAG: BNR-4 repeat-containing protein [Planctomycetales bacterium]|nr:BNR-4 repeat-containing protein [Planctomycetales bacterium]